MVSESSSDQPPVETAHSTHAAHDQGGATATSVESPDPHHQHHGDESPSCTMLVTCGAPALPRTEVALKAMQASRHALTLSVVPQYPNPTLLAHTPPPRA